MNIIDVGLKFGPMTMTNNPEILIVHHLEAEGLNWTIDKIHNMHKNEKGWAGIGYHYYIRLSGEIYKGRPDKAIGAHTQGSNYNTLGVAFEGNYNKRTNMTDAQFNSWCELKYHLNTKYGNMSVFGHKEKGYSECPGKYFPLNKVKTDNSINIKLGWNEEPKGWWYCTSIENKYYYKDCWKSIDGEYYLFNYEGYAVADVWSKYKDKLYYLKSNCMMAKSQWLNIDDEWYCFDKDGVLYIDCKTPDGYQVDLSGAWVN